MPPPAADAAAAIAAAATEPTGAAAALDPTTSLGTSTSARGGAMAARPAPRGAAAVSAADPRAAAAGAAMLEQGGSAADAAIAVMIALTVVEPQSAGIGGGGFLLYHDAGTGRLASFDGRELSPAGAQPGMFLDAAGTPLPFRRAVEGGTSVGVPGSLRLAAEAHRRFGRLPWAALFQPAIRLADDGYEVTPRLHGFLTTYAGMLGRSAEGAALYLEADGRPRPVGARIRNPALARLLREIAARGAAHFYSGTPARRLVEAVRTAPSNPSSMTESDVSGYEAKLRPPLCGAYRQWRICGAGPPSAGATTVFGIMKALERFDIGGLGRDSPTAWHLLAEAMRLAYADRDKWIADPDKVAVPAAGLMDAAYLARRAALIAPDRTMAEARAGQPDGAPEAALAPGGQEAGTSHIAAADAAGNVASFTDTVESVFGSGILVDGYVLNNELTDFSFVPAVDGVPVANRVEGRKRPRSSMAPTIVYGPDGGVRLAIGAAGGSTIPAQVAKALVGVLDWGLPAAEAIALPQIMGYGEGVRVEEGSWLAASAGELRALGHEVAVGGFPLKANAVERTAGGWTGGADPRSEGVVMTIGQDGKRGAAAGRPAGAGAAGGVEKQRAGEAPAVP